MVIHKTFLALDRMTKQLDNNNVSYEIIAHIDNGDEATTNYIKSIEKSHKLRVFYNSFGEPAQSRNFSIEQANGKYVCLMDGDDLFSENWLIDAYRLLQSHLVSSLVEILIRCKVANTEVLISSFINDLPSSGCALLSYFNDLLAIPSIAR